MDESLVRTSRFLSYVLRHDPASVGLRLDYRGWARTEDLIRCAGSTGVVLSEETLRTIIRESDKPRFSLSDDGARIRANYGHSVSVVPELEAAGPPPVLYHGTATRFVASIREEGLTPRGRRHVHLSTDRETAIDVGGRHGRPVVLTVDTRGMREAGAEFLRGPGGLWLTEHVPPEYLGFPE